jgi:hypothetical protein
LPDTQCAITDISRRLDCPGQFTTL